MNIIAGLVGRSLRSPRAVVKIGSPQFELICMELGLEDTIVPAQMTGRYLADIFEGQDLLELSAMIKDEARVFSFVLPAEREQLVSQLGLLSETRVICVYRNNKFMLVDQNTKLHGDDEVVVMTRRKNLATLTAPWAGLVRTS